MTDYHTVNEDDGSMLISVSRETNHHGRLTNAEQYRMHVDRRFFPCKGFRHVRQ